MLSHGTHSFPLTSAACITSSFLRASITSGHVFVLLVVGGGHVLMIKCMKC